MDTSGDSEKNDNFDKIQVILNVLKKQIDQYDHKENSTTSETETIRGKKIERLTMVAKNLLEEDRRIRKEIHHYEKKFEKALKKTVKHMKLQVQEDQMKLDTLKQQYSELNAKAGIEDLLTNKEQGPSFKPPVVKKRNNEMHRIRPKFKPRIALVNKKIRIKIKTNKKLGKREILFVNDDNVQQPLTKLVKPIAPPKALNARECKITLQRLTDEQMKRYKGQIHANVERAQKQAAEKQRPAAEKQKQTSEKSQQANKSNKSKNGTDTEPDWHIKIPKSVLEESMQGDNLDLSTTSDTTDAISTN